MQEYERLKAARAPEAPLLFADAVHFQHNTAAAAAWAKKGERPRVKSNSGRQRYNLLGGYCRFTGHFIGRATVGKLDSAHVIEWIGQLEQTYPEAPEIIAFVDNASYFHARVVKERLQGSRVRFVFLPPYSPNLNLIERLWKLAKKKVLANRYYAQFSTFQKAILGFFKNLETHCDELSSFLTDNFEVLPCG